MNTKTVYLIICVTLFVGGLSGCFSEWLSSADRNPYSFRESFAEEKLGSIHWAQYAKANGNNFPVTILKIDGQEIVLKDAHIRDAAICRTCRLGGIEAVAFRVISNNRYLRGNWVLKIKNGEKKFYHLCSNISFSLSDWEKTRYLDTECEITFDAYTEKCTPDDCRPSKSLLK